MTTPEQRAELADAVSELLDALDTGTALDAGSFEALLASLTRYVQATVPSLEREEAVDSIDAALLEFIEAASTGTVERAASPAGLLLRLTHSRAVDLARRRHRQDLPLDERDLAEPDDPDPLDAIASEEEVTALMRDLAAAGRHELNDVLRAWLDISERYGRATVRSVAARIGVDPSTVSRRLSEVREWLERGR
jgi:DNA-directed RNA polymerase specialized sigma24 family protein